MYCAAHLDRSIAEIRVQLLRAKLSQVSDYCSLQLSSTQFNSYKLATWTPATKLATVRSFTHLGIPRLRCSQFGITNLGIPRCTLFTVQNHSSGYSRYMPFTGHSLGIPRCMQFTDHSSGMAKLAARVRCRIDLVSSPDPPRHAPSGGAEGLGTRLESTSSLRLCFVKASPTWRKLYTSC